MVENITSLTCRTIPAPDCCRCITSASWPMSGLKAVDKTASIDTHSGKLSGGNQQRWCCLNGEPPRVKIILLDHLPASLDIGAKRMSTTSCATPHR